MNALKSTQEAATAMSLGTNQKTPFIYAEECGLVLLFNRRNGRKFYIDRENWEDLTLSLSSGWSPGKS